MAIVQHLHWLDSNLIQSLSLDDIIQQIVQDDVEMPNWTRAIDHFNHLSSNTVMSVVNVSTEILNIVYGPNHSKIRRYSEKMELRSTD